MKNKLLTLFLSIIMLISLSVGAEEEKSQIELLDNGSFELYTEEVSANNLNYYWPVDWILTGTESSSKGEDYKLSDKFAKDGKYSMMCAGGREKNSTRVVCELRHLVPDAVYEITGSILIDGSMSGSGAYFEARQYNYGGTSYYGKSTQLTDTKNKWVELTAKFVAPENGTAYLWLYKYGSGGDAYFDDFSVKPANDGIVINGSFEYETVSGAAQQYKFENAETDTKEAYEGNKSVTISSGGKAMLYSNYSCSKDNSYMKPGVKYTMSFMAKQISKRQSSAEVLFLNADKQIAGNELYKFKTTGNSWEKFSFDFTVPEGAEYVSVTLNGAESGSINYDCLEINNNSLKSLHDEAVSEFKAANAPLEIKEPVQGTGELIENGDFEKLNGTGDGAEGFSVYGGSWGAKGVSLSDKDPHSGKYCVKLKGDGSPWAMYPVKVLGGAEYQITAWVKRLAVTDDKGPYIKFEFYDEAGSCGLQCDSQSFISVTELGKWTQVAARIKAPDSAVTMKAYFRLNKSGEVYYDNVSCTMTAMPQKFNLNTDEVFYYTGSTGRLTLKIDTSVFKIGAGSYYDIEILDGEAVITSKYNIPAENFVNYLFDVNAMKETGKEYILRVSYKNADGTLIEEQKQGIYRYDRPSILDVNGNLKVDGEIFTPVIPYHVLPFNESTKEDLVHLKEAGCNVADSQNSFTAKQSLEFLDKAQEAGIKAFISLYGGMKPAASSDNLKNTIETVNLVKDHPALLGYIVMDEPYLHDTHDNVTNNLKNSYKTIRDIDKTHVVSIMETIYNKEMFPMAGKFCDVFLVDPYPGAKTKLGTYTENVVRSAQEAVNYKKPVYSVIQAFDWQKYIPSANDIRYQVYASLFTGADGFGYFKFRAWSEPYNHLWTYTGEDGMWTGITSFAENEQEDATNLFIKGKYPVFNYAKNDSVYYITYIKNNEVYLIAMNLKNEPVSMEIPLTSYDGRITLGSFTAEAVDISGASPVSGDGKFLLTLPETTVAKYKLKLSITPDFSGITTMTYRDLGRYGWAREAIEVLKAKNIVNDVNDYAFMPGENITRGDFALFLIETLGLTAGTGENFTDVAECAEYAKAVAVGKALGILNGIGDNRFQPEKEITRQDLMTIIARAMKLTSDENALSSFPDAGLVSDYAVSGVGAMVTGGLVKGNADGTLNPLGNTTRAEAAVIMYRVLGMK